MKLSECLGTADIGTLRKIAVRYDFSCSKHSKLLLMQEILFAFRSPAFLKEEAPNWQHNRDSAMLRLCLDSRDRFSVEEFMGIWKSGGGDAKGLEEALSEGWFYTTNRFGGRPMYCVPDEIKAYLRERLIKRLAENVTAQAEGPLVFEEDGMAASRDLDVFLEYVRHHEVNLTADGSMYKRSLTQILELLEVAEQPLSGGWRFGYGRRFHDYPDRFALLYDFAYKTRLIEERDDSVLQVTDVSSEFASSSELERQRALVQFYLLQYRRPIPRLPQIVQVIARIASSWVASRSMLLAVDSLVNDYYYDSKDMVWQARVVHMLTKLGLIRRGTDENDEVWFQITKLGQQLLTPDVLSTTSAEEEAQANRILIVQPNFEIVVTAGEPLVTAELAAFAELRQAGVVRLYRLTQDSVQSALMAGKNLDEWLGFVQRHSQSAFPGNVERTLREWDRTLSMSSRSMTS